MSDHVVFEPPPRSASFDADATITAAPPLLLLLCAAQVAVAPRTIVATTEAETMSARAKRMAFTFGLVLSARIRGPRLITADYFGQYVESRREPQPESEGSPVVHLPLAERS